MAGRANPSVIILGPTGVVAFNLNGYQSQVTVEVMLKSSQIGLHASSAWLSTNIR
ncbi:11533_t:CDS:2 [Funneliformis caledonium]|uniref:11533_t:CDS:1 n=1 Tax=Funneliformis caledonium TaxID=1117310 RepID=A0A9N8Z4J1_9GLOM|nr:11533_t:CDS:2 [Funneliformis caledonium]